MPSSFVAPPSIIHPSTAPSIHPSVLIHLSTSFFPSSFVPSSLATIAPSHFIVRLPSVVAKKQPARGDEQADHDGGGRGASDIVGLVPAHGEARHGAQSGRAAPRQAKLFGGVAVAGSVGCWRCRLEACRRTIGGGWVSACACVVVVVVGVAVWGLSSI